MDPTTIALYVVLALITIGVGLYTSGKSTAGHAVELAGLIVFDCVAIANAWHPIAVIATVAIVAAVYLLASSLRGAR